MSPWGQQQTDVLVLKWQLFPPIEGTFQQVLLWCASYYVVTLFLQIDGRDSELEIRPFLTNPAVAPDFPSVPVL